MNATTQMVAANDTKRGMSAAEMLATLTGYAVGKGSLVWFDYVAGSKSSLESQLAAEESLKAGMSPHHYIGELVGVELNQEGQPYLTIKALNRCGELRRINPAKGTLRGLVVLKVCNNP